MDEMDENIINSAPEVETVTADTILSATPGYDEEPKTEYKERVTSTNSASEAVIPGEGKATASLIMGIIATVGGVSGIVSIVLGIIGLVMASKSKQEGYNGGLRTGGFAFSLIGLILGILSTLLVCAMVLGIGGLSMAAFSELASYS